MTQQLIPQDFSNVCNVFFLRGGVKWASRPKFATEKSQENPRSPWCPICKTVDSSVESKLKPKLAIGQCQVQHWYAACNQIWIWLPRSRTPRPEGNEKNRHVKEDGNTKCKVWRKMIYIERFKKSLKTVSTGWLRNRKPEPSEPFFPKPKAEPEPREPFSRNRNRNRNRPFLLNCTETKRNLFCRGTAGTENRNRLNRSIPKP